MIDWNGNSIAEMTDVHLGNAVSYATRIAKNKNGVLHMSYKVAWLVHELIDRGLPIDETFLNHWRNGTIEFDNPNLPELDI